MIRVAIVDDEDLARAVAREFLAGHADIEIVAECADGFECVKTVQELRPDLLLLDIQMPKLDGFEALELLDTERLAVIFLTAYDQYAMRAFEIHAVDYLLKPFSKARLDAALERARARLGERPPEAAALAAAARGPGQFLERIVVKDGARVQVIPAAKLDWVEAEDDYVSLHSEGRAFLKQQTIASLEERLDPSRFLRIHRSVIVNLERVERIEPYTKDSRVAILAGGTKLPVSRAGYARLMELLEARG
jgi:two-component system LytT family response regulator